MQNTVTRYISTAWGLPILLAMFNNKTAYMMEAFYVRVPCCDNIYVILVLCITAMYI